MGPVRGWRIKVGTVAIAVVLFVILLVLAGQSGFAHAEGQRALPAWEMLVSGDFFVPRLFGQACLRKPPGVPWLIALASVVFGHTHFAARVVSIGSMLFASVCSAYFARRWFHRPGVGTLAGLTMCLFPLWYWYPPVAPSAEIEAPFVACTLLTTLLMLDTLCGAWRTGSSGSWPFRCAAIALASGGMFLCKGPAGLVAVLPACAVGFLFAPRGAAIDDRPRPSKAARTTCGALGLTLGAAVLGAWMFLAAHELARTGESAVLQSPGEFLYRPSWSFAGFVSMTLLAGLPFVLVLTAVLRAPGVRVGVEPTHITNMTHALAGTFLFALIATPFVGVSNPRHALPVLALLPMLTAGWASTQLPHRARTGRAMLPPFLRHANATLVALGVVSIALTLYAQHRRSTRTTGETEAAVWGALLVGPAELWGDELMDQRPEIAFAATHAASAQGHKILPRWTPLSLLDATAPAPLPPVGSYLLVRTDTRPREKWNPAELPRYLDAGLLQKCRLVAIGQAHIFQYRVYQRTIE